MAELTNTPYSTVLPFVGGAAKVDSGLPKWLNAYDAQRLASYAFYEDLYANNPSQFKLMLRGAEDSPIYIPSARRIINTVNRYVGKGIGFRIDNAVGPAYEAAVIAIGDFFKRERLVTEFNKAKKQMLKFGDGCMYLTADPAKPQGSRIKCVALDPGSYFPIEDPEDPDKIIGQDIVEQIVDPVSGNTVIKRQRYLKNTHPDHPSFGNYAASVQYQVDFLELTDWEDPKKAKPANAYPSVPPILLASGIVSLPIYHFKNGDESGPFGVSELRGMERLFLGINQAITDEDVALAMAGLGMYVADSSPVDDAGVAVNWIIGPKRVVEVPKGGTFTRLQGISSVSPSQDHVNYLQKQAESTLGISDVALGQVDVTVAQSGIALALRMGPLLDAAEEKDSGIIDVMNQFFYDLKIWLQAYEQINLGDAVIEPSFKDKLPKDKEAEATRLQSWILDGIISIEFFRDEMSKLYGYDFPSTMQGEIDAASQGAIDPYATDSQGNYLDPNAALAADNAGNPAPDPNAIP